MGMTKIKGTAKMANITVIKVPLMELIIRLSCLYNNDNDIRNIVYSSITDGYESKDGLVITYDTNDNIFVIVNSNPKYKELTIPYIPDEEPNFIDKICSTNPKNYRFTGGGSFKENELNIIKEAKHNNDPQSKLITKMVKEMMTRNMYNYNLY